MSFVELLEGNPDVSVERTQAAASERFPELVERSRMRLYGTHRGALSPGLRLVIGVAVSFSISDLRLLDELDLALERPNANEILVEVFDVATCRSQGDFQARIPGLGNVYQTPVLGVWMDDQQHEALQGAQARERVKQLVLGLDKPTD